MSLAPPRGTDCGDPLTGINVARNVVTVIEDGVAYHPQELLERMTTYPTGTSIASTRRSKAAAPARSYSPLLSATTRWCASASSRMVAYIYDASLNR